jgi:uncharacterized membrane protein YczE
MLITLLIFLVFLVVAYAAWRLLPPPADWIVAAIVVILGLFYLVSNVGELEGADAAMAGAAGCLAWRLP